MNNRLYIDKQIAAFWEYQFKGESIDKCWEFLGDWAIAGPEIKYWEFP